MMTMYGLITLGVLFVMVAWGIAQYNRLTRLRNDIVNAFAQIDVQLKRRYDLIPNLVEVAKKYLIHEHDTLEAVIRARQIASDANHALQKAPANAAMVAALSSAEQQLGGSLGRLFAVAENYPELKADVTLRELADELTSTENKVGFTRQAYNDAVLEFNNAAQEFPTLIVSRLFGFTVAVMLQSTQSAKERDVVHVQL